MASGRHSGPPASDPALMTRTRQGDTLAFQELYDRYHRALLDFFYGLTRSPDAADDLCQETFVRVWKLRARYEPAGSFRAYLFAVARRIWLERGRQMRRGLRLGMPIGLEEGAEHIPAEKPLRPDAAAAQLEIEQRVFQALDALPEEQRMVFLMRVVQGLSLDEIAEAMMCPVNTVRSRKLLAIKKLREALRGLLVI